ncbi:MULTISPECIES: ion transporter [Psychrobacter]|jgi:voltage-gated potassium channel|uniref:Potassium voltage-gated channel subfamily KQT, possible potassium channel, VIC family n=2 Tax=Psychrobacter TaxID=497 RepID=A0A6N7C0B9_9GAMM|nr:MULTISPECIES: ion transporter [Psychrobacter]AOY42928.1 voltage-gated potassium channel [Psychrobacter sp. AntiMn-1]KAF0568227.1 Potassium voltage-gated channel subfamily KQT, possible potassium channel, VIC family [Psychrobacter nivimaris]KRG36957.1 ion transporter [Psychrobacter sp. P11G3]MBA6243163.1 ion transporter [Psychrobacter sp. Urea-trap-18]MBA6286221.1 ion transporter [Psychrobacter sp. Urea-trap-16]|tara:strand:+ start:8961 stop:9791 length:831 start_codon:yes stop_codon:yes gene_type:complete
MKQPTAEALTHLRNRTHIIIEGTDTRLGKLFDIVLLIAILASVAVVMLDSVLYMRLQYGTLFFYAEWFFTILFTIEYALRLFSAPNRLRYAFSFFGIVDLLSVLPSYLSLMFVGVQYLLVIRVLRILRVFRVLKLKAYMQQAGFLASALKTSQQKITVFFLSLVLLVTIFGSIIYVVEGPENGFTSIPLSIYWAVVTMTTVGYGDMSPKTPLGQAIATMVMITGYSIIAVPTGIFTSELARNMRPQLNPVTCPNCGKFGHAVGADFCDRCGHALHI